MKIKQYINDSYNELVHKVSWPTWPELQNSAIVVMVASLILSLIVYLMDVSFSTVIKEIYSLAS